MILGKMETRLNIALNIAKKMLLWINKNGENLKHLIAV